MSSNIHFAQKAALYTHRIYSGKHVVESLEKLIQLDASVDDYRAADTLIVVKELLRKGAGSIETELAQQLLKKIRDLLAHRIQKTFSAGSLSPSASLGSSTSAAKTELFPSHRATMSNNISLAHKAALYTHRLYSGKMVVESLQNLVRMKASLEDFRAADTEIVVEELLRKGAGSIETELAQQLLKKMRDLLALRIQKTFSAGSVSPMSTLGSSTSSSSAVTTFSTSSTVKNPSTLEEFTTSKRTSPKAIGGTVRAPTMQYSPARIPRVQKTSVDDDERLRKFIEKQKAKRENATTGTKMLSERQAELMARRAGRRKFK